MARPRRCGGPSSARSASPRPDTGSGSRHRLRGTPMQIAILLYDRFTALDAIGPYEVLSRLDHAEVIFAAERPGPVRADTGMLTIPADAAIGELAHPDIV